MDLRNSLVPLRIFIVINYILTMGKRIRHLEFYGYPEQNMYIGLPNTDVSDMREINREQDKEILAISGATAGKADYRTVLELSGTVNTFINIQNRINDGFSTVIRENTERISRLEERDGEITSKINEIVDDFNPINEELSNLSSRITGVDDRLTRHINETSGIESAIYERLDELDSLMEDKLSKSEADTLYAKAGDYYTKPEVDDLLRGATGDLCTKEWVLGRGYIAEIDADTKYATKQALNGLNDRMNEMQTTLYRQYNELSTDLNRFKNDTNGRIDTLYGRIDTLESKHDREIASVNTSIENLQRDVRANSDAITTINTISLPNKVDKVDFNDLRNEVANIRTGLDGMVDDTTYNHDIGLINSKIELIRDTYATKHDLNVVASDLTALSERVTTEVENSIARDEALGERIDGLGESINTLTNSGTTMINDIAVLRGDLEAEITNRIRGDENLLGKPTDAEVDNTIYGCKRYADKVANQAKLTANDYTDNKDADLRLFINDEVKLPLQQEISAKADKQYINDVKAELEDKIVAAVSEETDRAVSAEEVIRGRISTETDRAINQERIIMSGLTHTSNIVAALTDWDGDDRRDYTDAGNGIVDVMHREIHDLKNMVGNMSEGVETTNENEAAFGTYNKSNTGYDNSEKTIFSIGNGTSELDRKNAFEVRKNGDIYMTVGGEYICINSLLEKVALIQS